MLNFTVGPVQIGESVLNIGSEQVPYFRTPEFSAVMRENENLMLEFTYAPKNSRAVFLTGSGTAAMEAAVINALTEKDKVLIINGGSFGQRFTDICKIHNIPFDEIKLPYGSALTKEILSEYESAYYSAMLINLHETSTGVLYDINLVKDFCAKKDMFLIVDAISCFLAEDISVSRDGIDVLLTGSQKALACPPGVSVLVLSEKAVKRVFETPQKCMYLDLKSALINGERGQTPFTPAVSILLQINQRLKEIKANGGVKTEIEKVKSLAEYFRDKIKPFPFKNFSSAPSNAVTALKTDGVSAHGIFTILKDEYGIWVCPNGGELKETVFRVGHIGNLTFNDYDTLINALYDMKKRGLING